MLVTDFCSAKMAQVHWLVEILIEMYKGHGHGQKYYQKQVLDYCK